MNPKIILLVGLPGSGKSTLGNKLIMENPDSIFFDDISVSGMPELKKELHRKKYNIIVVADSFLCRTNERANAERFFKEMGHDVEWIFFENDPAKCLINVDYRNDGRKVKDLIELLSKEYDVPVGFEVRGIVNP